MFAPRTQAQKMFKRDSEVFTHRQRKVGLRFWCHLFGGKKKKKIIKRMVLLLLRN